MDYMSGLSSTKRVNDFVFVVVDSFSKMLIQLLARRASQQKPLPSSSLNESGYIFGSHKPFSQIRTIDFSVHSASTLYSL